MGLRHRTAEEDAIYNAKVGAVSGAIGGGLGAGMKTHDYLKRIMSHPEYESLQAKLAKPKLKVVGSATKGAIQNENLLRFMLKHPSLSKIVAGLGAASVLAPAAAAVGGAGGYAMNKMGLKSMTKD